jgi:hypothetical protein
MGGLINLRDNSKIGLWIIVLLTAVTVSALAAVMVLGLLTPRDFGIVAGGVTAAAAIAFYFCLKSFARQRGSNVTPTQSVRKSAKGLYLRIGIILSLFVVSALATRGGPLLPRLIGASVLILYLVGSVIARR